MMVPPDYDSAASLDQQRAGILKFFADFPFFKLLGVRLVEIEPHRSVLTLNWREDLCQPAGILHGGVIATIIDTAIAQSMLLTPAYREARKSGGQIVTVDLGVKYLRPVSGGSITCEARTPRIGRTITHSTAVVTDSAGKEVATGDSIYMLVTADLLRKKPS